MDILKAKNEFNFVDTSKTLCSKDMRTYFLYLC